MNSNIKRILTTLLAAALVVTTVFPGSRPVYAEEKPTTKTVTTEEEKQASPLQDTLQDEDRLDKQGQTNPEETGKQNIVDQNALRETDSPQEKQEEAKETTGTSAPFSFPALGFPSMAETSTDCNVPCHAEGLFSAPFSSTS